MLAMFVQFVPPLLLFSQFCIAPVLPLKVKVPVDKPSQTDVPPLTLPPTVAGSTVTVVEDEATAEQVPLFTTARYNQVPAVEAVSLYGLAVLAMLVQLVPPLLLFSQFCMAPVLPLRVRLPVDEF